MRERRAGPAQLHLRRSGCQHTDTGERDFGIEATGTNLVTGTTTLGSATVACGNFDLFDPQPVSAVTAAPAFETVSTAFNVTVDGTVRNNGPTSNANTDIDVTLNMAGDCTADGSGPGATKTEQDLDIPDATPVNITQQTFSVTCNQPSNHTFTATIETILDEASGVDSNSANNSLTSAASVSPSARVRNLAVDSVNLSDASGQATVNAPFPVQANVILDNLGPYGPANADTTVTLTLPLPPDCSTVAPNPVSVGDVSVPVPGLTSLPSVTWLVTCTQDSSHNFSADATVAVDQPHVSDPAGGNDSNSGAANISIAPDGDSDGVGDPYDNHGR